MKYTRAIFNFSALTELRKQHFDENRKIKKKKEKVKITVVPKNNFDAERGNEAKEIFSSEYQENLFRAFPFVVKRFINPLERYSVILGCCWLRIALKTGNLWSQNYNIFSASTRCSAKIGYSTTDVTALSTTNELIRQRSGSWNDVQDSRLRFNEY